MYNVTHLSDQVKMFCKRLLMMIIYYLRKRKKKVVFTSFFGNYYSDNPRAISEKLHEVDPSIEIVWLFNRPEDKMTIVPSYVRVAKNNTLNILLEYTNAKVWVKNFQIHKYFYKGKDQLYIQTWHGDKVLKKILYESNKLNFKSGDVIENNICDLCIAGSEGGVNQYRNGFRYEGKILKVGMPRNDILVKPSNDKNDAIRKYLNIPEGAKIALYAPTFRDETGLNCHQNIGELDIERLLNTLELKTNSEWCLLVRAHPSLLKGIEYREDNKKMKDVSNYEDMKDLLSISDLLITDYSGSAGDFAIKGKQVILYQYDKELYENKSRDLLFEMSETPFIVVQTNDELNQIIDSLTDEMTKENCSDILSFYGSFESGKSSEAIARIISEKCEEHQ